MGERGLFRSRWMMRLFPRRECPDYFIISTIGVFLLFMPVGFQFELARGGDANWARGLANAGFGGVIACVWFALGTFRLWWLMPFWAAGQFLLGAVMGRLDQAGRLTWDAVLSSNATLNLLIALSMATLGCGFAILIHTMIKTTRRTQAARAELDVARRVHESIVPPIDLRIPGVRVLARSRASSTMGGDLIDVVRRDGELDLFVADVSGHGVKAGIVMAMLKSAVRTRLGSGGTLGEILADVNRALEGLTDPSMFATLACVRIRPGAGGDGVAAVEYALAGHLPIFHVRTGGVVHDLCNECLPLGIEPSERYVAGRITAERGDALVLATDGLVEVHGRDGREFGLGALRQAVRSMAASDLEAMHSGIMGRVDAHGPQIDDQTLAVARIE
jgi:serine phosphatase RsbU (regulator of sigma subunit)